jgi:hypothetical protein
LSSTERNEEGTGNDSSKEKTALQVRSFDSNQCIEQVYDITKRRRILRISPHNSILTGQ